MGPSGEPIRKQGRDFLQSASNAVASNVSGPVDLIAMGLRGAGLPVPQNPVGGSQWMAQRGLTRDVPMGAARIAGETLGMAGPAVLAAKAPQVAAALNQGAANLAAPTASGQAAAQRGAIVWHGSPHKFDKFDSSKIGTGEGAQAYGHGLYLAESPDVAKTYKDLNPTALSAPIRAFRGAELNPGTPEYHAATLLDNMGLQQARKTVSGWIASARPEMAREADGWRKTLETLNAATSKADFKQLKNQGNMYRVDLPDDMIARMLDWDAPLSQQAPGVQQAVGGIKQELTGPFSVDMTGDQLLRHVQATLKGVGRGSTKAEEELRRRGVPGIRYLDGGSRGAGSGTSNFVVFPGEESALRILERNNQPLLERMYR